MKWLFVVLVGILVFTGAMNTVDAAAPVLSNVQAQQRGGTGGAGAIVDITYDVEDVDSDSVMVSVEVSNDGGTTFDVPAASFAGDIGEVAVGAGRAVEWYAGQDVPGEYWEQCQVKVTAEDGDTSPETITVDLPGGATMDMVRVAPGTFTMGSPADEPERWNSEGPEHEVTIPQGFYLGKYELTQGQWESVMGTTPWEADTVRVQHSPNNPAVHISWYKVQDFIDSLNVAEGDWMYRLPTEAEWEYACRAGTETIWSFGDDGAQLGQYAWFADNATNVGEVYAHEVGTKLPNQLALHDMHGNVYEWCRDR